MALTGPHPAATAVTGDEARAGRSEADWAVIRDPVATAAAIAEILAGGDPKGSPVLREVFSRAFAAYSRGDWELNTILLQREDFVFRPADFAEALPDAGGDFPGVVGYLRIQRLFNENWDEMRVELDEVVHADSQCVVVTMRLTGRGKRSGAPFEQLALGELRFRDGEVTEQTYWWNRARGLEALGLRAPA